MWHRKTQWIKLLCRMMDRLDMKKQVKWEDVYNDRFGPGNDTLIGMAASMYYHVGDVELESMRYLIQRCIDADRRDLIFVKNRFGMNLIDNLMVVYGERNYGIDRSKFAQMLIQKFQIDETTVEASYKNAIYSRELFLACEASDLTRIKSILDEIKDNNDATGIDVINMACYSTRILDHCNVKYFCICVVLIINTKKCDKM